MTCDRYWREGILLVERDLPDPHREGCDDCARAHAARAELVESLPLIGEGYTGDPHWQANVWQRIDGDRAPGGARWRWLLEGALAAACVLLLWLGIGRSRPSAVPGDVAMIEIHPGEVKRSRDPHVDDSVDVIAGPATEVRIYREQQLVLQCSSKVLSQHCEATPQGIAVHYPLSQIAHYEVFVVSMAAPAPRGDLDQDSAALTNAGFEPIKHKRYSVH